MKGKIELNSKGIPIFKSENISIRFTEESEGIARLHTGEFVDATLDTYYPFRQLAHIEVFLPRGEKKEEKKFVSMQEHFDNLRKQFTEEQTIIVKDIALEMYEARELGIPFLEAWKEKVKKYNLW